MERELTKQDIVSAFFRLCRLQFGDNSYQPKLDHTFEYLKFDALDIKGLVMSCEEVFGVDMGDPLAERPNINNLHGIFNVLMDKLVAGGKFIPKRHRRQADEEAGEGSASPEAEDEAPAPSEDDELCKVDVDDSDDENLPDDNEKEDEDEIPDPEPELHATPWGNDTMDPETGDVTKHSQAYPHSGEAEASLPLPPESIEIPDGGLKGVEQTIEVDRPEAGQKPEAENP